MRFVDALRGAALLAVLALLTACGGSSTTSSLTGPGVGDGKSVPQADQLSPTGDNTTQIVVDSGPAGGFGMGTANVPYVTVTVCAPGSSTACVTIDHVFVDTGSIGLRVLASQVASLNLPAGAVPPAGGSGASPGAALECYPFVLGAVWGPLATADVRIAGERAASLPIQLIDDSNPPATAVPADCLAAANGGLMNSASSLQANGILGIGMLAYDCGATCAAGDYTGGYTLYYACASAGACTPAAMPVPSQVQNPVTYFPVDNNGTIISLPALPDLGAGIATGRLVFGIGTQANNQIDAAATKLFVDPDPTHPSYLYFTTLDAGTSYPDSYIDSGTNALFFGASASPSTCQNQTGSSSTWYCPATFEHRHATLTGVLGTTAAVAYDLTSADVLFTTSSLALDDLGGIQSAGTPSFVWGLPFFYGRPVYTSIWGQALSPTGPWNAF
jgi:hypothetical protein